MKIVVGRGGPWLQSFIYGIFTPVVIIIALPFMVIGLSIVAVVAPFLGVLGLLKKEE